MVFDGGVMFDVEVPTPYTLHPNPPEPYTLNPATEIQNPAI